MAQAISMRSVVEGLFASGCQAGFLNLLLTGFSTVSL